MSHRRHNVTRDNVTNVQIGLPVPIFDRNQGNISSAEAELVAAKQAADGVTDAAKTAAAGVSEIGDAFQETANRAQELAEAGRRVTDEMRTPMEVFKDRVAELNQLEAAIAIIQAMLQSKAIEDPDELIFLKDKLSSFQQKLFESQQRESN